MKFNIGKTRDIINLDKDFAVMDGIDEYGSFIYSLSFWADIPKAISNDSIIVKISVYESNPLVTANVFEGAKNSREIVDGLKNHASKFKNTLRTARANPIVVKSADISSVISNTIAKKIKQDLDNASIYLGVKKQLVAVPVSEITGEIANNIPNLSVSKVVEQDTIKNNKSIKGAAIKSLLTGVDPSAVGEASFPINSSHFSIQGIDRKSSNLQPSSTIKNKKNQISGIVAKHVDRRETIQTRANLSVKNNVSSKYLRETLRNSASTQIDSISLMPTKTKVVLKEIPDVKRMIRETVRIPSEKINGLQDLHFLIELVNSKGDVLDVKYRTVNHDEEIEGFSTPDYAPHIHATAIGIGKNSIWIKQVDKIATEVMLYRKTINQSSPSIASEYRLIRKISLTNYDSHYRVVDLVNNSLTCVYRAVSVGPRNRISSTFKNSIVKPYKHATLNKRSVEELLHVSIFAQTQNDQVLLRVTNIPQGPIALYVTAEDLTKKFSRRNSRESIRIVGSNPEEQTRKVGSDINELTFVDKGVQHGHIYEYRVVLIYPNGSEIRSQITEVHEFLKDIVEKAKITVDLSGLAVQADGSGNITVTFNIEPSFTDVGMENIVGSLESAGADENFISEVKNDRNKLNKLLAFLVQRQDSESGETETFGVIATGQFVDDATSRGFSGVSSVKAGRNYRYIVRVLLRSAESMFADVAREDIDIETSRKFQKKISKFLNPTTLANGTLPPTGESFGVNSLSKIKPEDKFLQGRTGIEVGIDITIPNFRPTINSIIAQRAGPNKSLLYWTIEGDHNDIDHFVIMAEIHGVKSTVATVHNMSNQEKYHYFDYEVASEPGTVKYSIIPVFSDYAYGVETYANEITLKSNIPVFGAEK